MAEVRRKPRALLAAAAIAALVWCGLMSTGCHRKSYALSGEVISKSPDTDTITVRHEEIPGFMAAMTMPYRVKNHAGVEALQPGDMIAADIAFANDNDRSDYWLENIRVTGKTNRAEIGPRMLTPGEPAPDLTLTNQDGKTIHLSDFKGKALLVTFIYTRCPMPDFCPRLSHEFARIQNELKKTPEDYARTHLLTISFDPKYDRPAVLRKYGLTYLEGDASGFSHWDFASANPAELRRLAESFGLLYEAQDNQIVHNMSIVLIGPDGKIAKFWSTDWTWTELMATMQNVAHS